MLNVSIKVFRELNRTKFVNAFKYILLFLESDDVNAVPLSLKCDVCYINKNCSEFTYKNNMTIQS